MTWPSLASRLNALPRVLAGPMLRKVTPLSVTVWFALRAPARLTLRVLASGDTVILTGQADTCAVGLNLHIVAVTANQLTPPMTALAENFVYRYDVTFDFIGGESAVSLAAATDNASLAYAPFALPSFALPPSDLNQVRLLQGSCRRPYAGARDMLPLLDDFIRVKADKPLERPHQLLLTGDQIYADDVSDPMRMLVTDAAAALLGWEEVLPIPPHFGGPVGARDVPGAMRWAVLKTTGFPSSDLRSHLMSLGEYLSMYLLVWSPVLWPTLLPPPLWRQQGAPGMPSVDEVRAEMKRGISSVENMLIAAQKFKALRKFPKNVVAPSNDKKWIGATMFTLALFQSKLVDVRRALANVPSYMIFDDHEITDDWNMTTAFCNSVYGSPLGMQMVQNGLVAYSLCQHWGNVPELFESSSGTPPAGARLLALLDTADPGNPESYRNKAAQYASHAVDLRRVLAIHDAATLRALPDRAVFHDADALRYDFTVEGQAHQVIFADTRTWRSFPPAPPQQFPQFSGDPGTHLLGKLGRTDQFQAQIVDTPPTNKRLLLVVLTTNAPPGQGIRGATRHNKLTEALADGPDLYEAWDLPSESFDRLLTALTTKLPLNDTGQHHGTVILLSGDVHHSFASRIGYRATRRYDDFAASARGASATIVQLVGSGLKNVESKTIGLHEDGYFYAPKPGLGVFIRDSMTEAYVGFSFPDSTRHDVGTCEIAGVPRAFNITVNKQTIDVSEGDAPWDRVKPRSVRLTVAPHYRYRLDYLVPVGTTPVVPPPKVLAPFESLRDYQDYAQAELINRRVNPKHVVGVANLCEIAVAGSPQPTTITHKVHWWDDYTKGVRTTTYVVPASVSAPNDPVFGDIKAASEP